MKILVIDDEINIARLIAQGLENSRHSVAVANNGVSGLSLALNDVFDLVILDLMMPGKDGMEVCQEIRKSNSRLPIIILTACTDANKREECLRSGANDFLSKPFSFRELLAKIDCLCLWSDVDNEDREPDEPSVLVSEQGEFVGHADIPETDDCLSKRILDSIPMSIITIDKNGFITSANKYYENFSKSKGFQRHNLFASEFFIRENLLNDYIRLLSSGEMVQRDSCFEKNSRGEDKYLKILAIPMYDASGNIDGALSMATDNTEAIMLKNQLQELNRQLEAQIKERTQALSEANEELKKALTSKFIFVADLSHELKTSLTIIQGNLELVAISLGMKAQASSAYGQVFNEIERITAMLADLTIIANADAGEPLRLHDRIIISELVLNACKSLEKLASENEVEVRISSLDETAAIIGDKNNLEKLFLNLLANAIKYNRKGGWVDIAIRRVGDEVLVSFRDNGVGIAAEDQKLIFDRFYRVDRDGSRSGGTGLGLAICKWVAEAHGGGIELKSELGQGSIFTIRLPINKQR